MEIGDQEKGRRICLDLVCMAYTAALQSSTLSLSLTYASLSLFHSLPLFIKIINFMIINKNLFSAGNREEAIGYTLEKNTGEAYESLLVRAASRRKIYLGSHTCYCISLSISISV